MLYKNSHLFGSVYKIKFFICTLSKYSSFNGKETDSSTTVAKAQKVLSPLQSVIQVDITQATLHNMTI